MSLWPIAATALIGAIAWFFQRAWERQQIKQSSYRIILDSLPAFTSAGLNPDLIDKAISEMRCLMLYAPENVVMAAEHFLEGSEKSLPAAEMERRLSAFIISMRNDCSFWSALRPTFWSSSLTSTKLAMKAATRGR
jgi:hypothetical protein